MRRGVVLPLLLLGTAMLLYGVYCIGEGAARIDFWI